MNPQTLIEKFIYSCSHDLRAPISSIQGLVRIAGYYPHHDETHKCLEMIEACTDKMDKLLCTLQEFMINNQRPLLFEELEVPELVKEIKSEFKNKLDACNINLIAEVRQPTLPCIDRFSMLTILKHLVSNSISYFDPEKSERIISIRVDSNEQDYILEVADNGTGISEEQQDRICDVFFRGTESSIGIGMGLFLVKSLVEKMGGAISCKSTLTKGTTIRITFPK